jgi:hypothetical protein
MLGVSRGDSMGKRLRDPVHGLIVFDECDPLGVDELAWSLIDTPHSAARSLRVHVSWSSPHVLRALALLSTRPATKASAIACVNHVAECGLATDEMRSWLAMLVESPLVT